MEPFVPQKAWYDSGHGACQVVSMLTCYSDDTSSSPADVVSVKFVLKRTKINKKRPGLAHFLKKYGTIFFMIYLSLVIIHCMTNFIECHSKCSDCDLCAKWLD